MAKKPAVKKPARPITSDEAARKQAIMTALNEAKSSAGKHKTGKAAKGRTKKGKGKK